jgi:thiol-disulfide isomerase/thioredoxin
MRTICSKRGDPPVRVCARTLDDVTATTQVRNGGTSSSGRRQRGYLVAALVLIAVALVAVLVGTRTNPSKVAGPVDTSHLKVGPVAPSLDAAKGWINSPPLTQADLKGKVVLYDFWTYSCINCQRTFPYLRSWFDRYTADGLVIVGVHSPEFDFEKVHKNVEAAVKRDDVTWPVALDDDMAIWNQFKNQYWPADYIADRQGHLRYTHFGEGDYSNTENVIRQLLAVPKTAARADVNVAKSDAVSSQTTNPETYLGLQFQNPSAPLIVIQAGAHDYPTPKVGSVGAPQVIGGQLSLAPGKIEAALSGKWTADAEAVTSDSAASTILIGVHAKEVNLVMSTATGKPIDAVLELDGEPVPAADRGSSVHVDGNGRTVVTVKTPDMYRLLLNPAVSDHVLTISAAAPGLQAFDFTFG